LTGGHKASEITEIKLLVMTLLYNHSLQEGALHTGETNIRPRTLSRYFVCDGVHKTFLASAQQENNPKASHLMVTLTAKRVRT